MPLKDEWGGVEVAELEDEFGGVAIDDDDGFGGVPLDETETARPDFLSDMGLARAPILPIGEAPLPQMDPSGMAFTPRDGGGFNFEGGQPPEESLLGTAKEALLSPFTLAGRGLNAAYSDLGAGIGTAAAGNLDAYMEQGGNLANFVQDPFGEQGPTPQQKVLADISRSNPATATVGKIAGGLVESAPLLAVMPQGALGKLVAAGFTADMIAHAPQAFKRIADQMYKPEAERNMDNLTSALAEIAQTAVFAPLAGAHAGGKVIGERVAPRREVIRELANELRKNPFSDKPIAPLPRPERQDRRLNLRLDQGENILGTPELRGLADRALEQGPNPPLARGEVSALERIRQELNPPPQLEMVAPTRLAERTREAGETTVRPSVEGLKVEPGFERGASDLLLERPNPFFDRASEAEGLGRTSTAPTVESIRAQRGAESKADPVSAMVEKLNQRKEKVSTDDVVDVGIQAKGVSDLQALADGWKKWKADLTEAKAAASKDPSKMAAYGAIAQRGQLYREAIESATNSGSHKIENRIGREKNLPEPKLDWKKNPEVAAWLKKNGEQLGIDVSEIKVPEVKAVRRATSPSERTAQELADIKIENIGELSKDLPGYLSRVTEELVHFARQAAKDPELRPGLTRAFENVAKAAQEQGVSLESLNKNLANEMKLTYGSNAAEMAESFFGKPSKAALEPTLESTPLDPQSGRSVSETQKFLDRANLWADEILNRDPRTQTRSGLDPAQEAQRIAAITIKGAVLIRDGVTNFKEWSSRMIEQYGEGIRSQLNDLWEKANNYAKSTGGLEPKPVLGGPQVQRGAESARIEPQTPTIEGGPERMRQSAARATTSENVPAPVQERIATAPESFYESQKYKSVEEAVAAAPDAELAAVPKSSNFYVASRLELSRRLFAEGKLEQGYEVFKEVSKQGTEWGQNINQFKMLKGTTPANIIDLVNQGLKEGGRDPLTKKQMEDLAGVADKSIEANKSLETAKNEWQKNPTDGNAKKAQDLLDAANKADLETQRKMNSYKVKNWPQMLKTFAQGNPLTPISHVANFVGNTLGAAMEGSSRSVANMIDATRAMLSGGERKVMSQPIAGSVAATKGFGVGLKKAPGILAKGSGDTIKGEYRAGLQPLRSLAKAFAKNPDVPTVGGKVPINERVRMAVEGTFGIAPEAMLRLLSAADKPAYEAARARLISEQSKIKNIPAKDRAMAQKFPELFFDKETLKQIKLESADAIFQRPSKAIDYLQSMIRDKGGDWGDLAFTMMVSPYKLTPWNLVVRTLQYNPLIAAAKTALEANKGNTRAAEISAGRMVVGSLLYGAGYYLYQNGLIGPSLEGRNESQKARLLSGEVLPPNHVNVSGLERSIAGGDPAFKPGDETVDLTRGGGAAGAILSSVANIGRKMEKKPESGGGELAASLVRDGVLEQANFTINQSFLKGVTGMLDAIQNGNLGPYVQGVENMILNVGTPNTLTAISRATRETAPDMKTDTVAQEFGNVVRNRFGILGADDYLPAKRDLFGEPMPQTPEGRNAILYHLFDISKGRQVTDDPVKLELYRLWRRTASSEVIPSIPERQITVDKKTYPLPTLLYSRFAELVGKERKVVLDEIVKNPEFNGLSDEAKISILEKVYRAGAETGKQKFLSESFDKLTPTQERAGFK